MELSRNDPCPCGSGKKYKKCCAAGDAVRASVSVIQGDGPKPPRRPPGIPEDPGTMPVPVYTSRGTWHFRLFKDVGVLEMRDLSRRMQKGLYVPHVSLAEKLMKAERTYRREHGRNAAIEFVVNNNVMELRPLDEGAPEGERPRVPGDPPDRPLEWLEGPSPRRLGRAQDETVPPPPEAKTHEGAVVSIDRARLDQVVDGVASAVRSITENEYKVGAHYVNICDHFVDDCRQAGHADGFEMMLDAQNHKTPFEVEWSAAVARAMSLGEAAKLGRDRATALLKLIQYMRAPELTNPLMDYPVPFLDKKGKPQTAKLSTLGATEMGEAADRAILMRLEEMGRAADLKLLRKLCEEQLIEEDLPGELAYPQYPLPEGATQYEREGRRRLQEAFGARAETEFAVFWRGGALYERIDFTGEDRQHAESLLDALAEELGAVEEEEA